MNSILITGCNRGLGLGLVKAFLSLPKPPAHIIATCRDIEKAEVNNLFLSIFLQLHFFFIFKGTQTHLSAELKCSHS